MEGKGEKERRAEREREGGRERERRDLPALADRGGSGRGLSLKETG